jgi:hypothetical protein
MTVKVICFCGDLSLMKFYLPVNYPCLAINFFAYNLYSELPYLVVNYVVNFFCDELSLLKFCFTVNWPPINCFVTFVMNCFALNCLRRRTFPTLNYLCSLWWFFFVVNWLTVNFPVVNWIGSQKLWGKHPNDACSELSLRWTVTEVICWCEEFS